MKNKITKVIEEFFEAYEAGDMIRMYACFITDFQRRVPLNYFLINEKYKQDIGSLMSIGEVAISSDRKNACVDVEIIRNGKKSLIGVALEKDFGQWKILPESLLSF